MLLRSFSDRMVVMDSRLISFTIDECVIHSLGFHLQKLVPQRGFEPPTCRLGGGRSIQLSYRGDDLRLYLTIV